METEELLDIAFLKLGLSKEFCEACQLMDLKTLREIKLLSPKDLIDRKGFSYRWLGELSEYLEKKELLHLLQHTSGRNYD